MSNTLDEAAEVATSMRGLFPRTIRIEVDEYENYIIVGGPKGLSAAKLRAEVAKDPVLAGTLGRLSFRTLR